MTLVVDDDASIGEALRTALAGKPVGLEIARDIATAKAMLDRQRFCGLVLDVVIDGGRGIDLLHYLRSRNLMIPTVIVSNAVPAQLREMLDDEMVKLIFHKPVEARLLASIVLGLCGIAM